MILFYSPCVPLPSLKFIPVPKPPVLELVTALRYCDICPRTCIEKYYTESTASKKYSHDPSNHRILAACAWRSSTSACKYSIRDSHYPKYLSAPDVRNIAASTFLHCCIRILSLSWKFLIYVHHGSKQIPLSWITTSKVWLRPLHMPVNSKKYLYPPLEGVYIYVVPGWSLVLCSTMDIVIPNPQNLPDKSFRRTWK